MEKGIGETFILKGERYMVCENTATNVSHCWSCAFRHVSCGALGLGECGRKYRADNKNVFFYKIVDDKENEKMNENIDLIEILKDCPQGTKLYSTIVGDVRFVGINKGDAYPIDVESCFSTKRKSFTKQGLYYKDEPGECLLFPSKEQRDWSKFEAPVEKFDYSTLKSFDKVLVRVDDSSVWRCSLFSYKDNKYLVGIVRWPQGIPYNDETKHLVGTTDMPDEKYIWWEK